MKNIFIAFILTAAAASPAFPAEKSLDQLLGLYGPSEFEVESLDVPAPRPPAENIPARTNWNDLVKKVLNTGVFYDWDGDLPASFRLEDITGPADAPRTADYISIWGDMGADGEFFPYYLVMISENWEIDENGNWRIEQWIHQLDMDGTPGRTSHNLIIEKESGQIIDYQNESLPADSPAAQNSRNALLEKWGTFNPSKK